MIVRLENIIFVTASSTHALMCAQKMPIAQECPPMRARRTKMSTRSCGPEWPFVFLCHNNANCHHHYLQYHNNDNYHDYLQYQDNSRLQLPNPESSTKLGPFTLHDQVDNRII